MISTDFFIIFFYCFWFFRLFFYFFCFSWVLYYFLLCFLHIFRCFCSQTSQGTRGRPIPPPFLESEFSVLTRLKSYSRQSGRLSGSKLSSVPAVRAYKGRYYEHPLGAECSLTVLPVMMLKKITPRSAIKTSMKHSPGSTYRRKIKLGSITTGQGINRALHAFHRLYQSQFFLWSF